MLRCIAVPKSHEGVGLQGDVAEYRRDHQPEAEEGRFISEIENERHMNVAFIGHDLKDKFFAGRESHRTNHHRGGRARLKSWVCQKRRARSSASRRTTS